MAMRPHPYPTPRSRGVGRAPGTRRVGGTHPPVAMSTGAEVPGKSSGSGTTKNHGRGARPGGGVIDPPTPPRRPAGTGHGAPDGAARGVPDGLRDWSPEGQMLLPSIYKDNLRRQK